MIKLVPTRLCITGNSEFSSWKLFSRSIDDFCAGDRVLVIVTRKIVGPLNNMVERYCGPMLLLREIYHPNLAKWKEKEAKEWRDHELVISTDKLIIFLPKGRKAKKNFLYRRARELDLPTRKVYYDR